MDGGIHAALAGWGNFYLLTGTAAAALTGLQFVVQSLMAANGSRTVGGSDPEGGIGAFGTPTVVHFTVALAVSCLMSVPWPGYGSLRAALAVMGAGTLLYSGIVFRRTRRQRGYVPVAEDWIFHVVLPTAAYAAMLLAAVRLGPDVEGPEFVIAGAMLLLICVGIHNAWDTVTYLIVIALRREPAESGAAPPPRREAGRRRGRRR